MKEFAGKFRRKSFSENQRIHPREGKKEGKLDTRKNGRKKLEKKHKRKEGMKNLENI